MNVTGWNRGSLVAAQLSGKHTPRRPRPTTRRRAAELQRPNVFITKFSSFENIKMFARIRAEFHRVAATEVEAVIAVERDRSILTE